MKSILLFTATVFAASSSECPIAKSTTSNIFAGWWGNGNFKQAQVLNALYQLQDIVTHDCNRKVFYVYGDGRITWANQLLHFYSSVPKNEFSESITPMPYNGRAAMYEVKTGDSCNSIENDLSLNQPLEQYNKNVYGWYGCNAISPGLTISVSEGQPHASSESHLFEQITWMEDYESAFNPNIPYINYGIRNAKTKLLRDQKLVKYTNQVESIYIALWAGSWIDNKNSVSIIDYFNDVLSKRFGSAKLLQYINGNDPNLTFGIIVTTNPAQAEEAVYAWSLGVRYTKGMNKTETIAKALYTLNVSKNNDILLPDIEIYPSKYNSIVMSKFVFQHNKTDNTEIDKFYSSLASSKYGVPSIQYEIAKAPNFPLDNLTNKAVYGPIDNEVISYLQKSQWVFEQGNKLADEAGISIVENESMLNMTTEVNFESGVCTVPIFIVNAFYQSPGMACNAYAHLSTTNNNVFTYTGKTYPVLKGLCGKKDSPRINNIPILKNKSRWQKATFPYNGEAGTVQCVDASDVWADGRSFQRFVNAEPAALSFSETTKFLTIDWSRCNPMDPKSPSRKGPLNIGEKYMVLIQQPDAGFSNCTKFTRK
jgi:hypothetical protein